MAKVLTKKLAIAALFGAAALGLAACKDEAPEAQQAQLSDREAGRGIYDTSHVDRDYVITLDDLAIRTATGRELHVTARAYCQTEVGEHGTLAAYKDACREIVGQKLMYGARMEHGWNRFEFYPAMDNTDIRPWASFTEDMLIRAVPRHHKYDLYTITDIRQCADGTRVPVLRHSGTPYPSLAERAASRTAVPAIGRFNGTQCRFE